jgi:hypothetical protein
MVASLIVRQESVGSSRSGFLVAMLRAVFTHAIYQKTRRHVRMDDTPRLGGRRSLGAARLAVIVPVIGGTIARDGISLEDYTPLATELAADVIVVPNLETSTVEE